ncbi:hypothetical protein Tco_0434382 [Tanacetum coccineum]
MHGMGGMSILTFMDHEKLGTQTLENLVLSEIRICLRTAMEIGFVWIKDRWLLQPLLTANRDFISRPPKHTPRVDLLFLEVNLKKDHRQLRSLNDCSSYIVCRNPVDT